MEIQTHGLTGKVMSLDARLDEIVIFFIVQTPVALSPPTSTVPIVREGQVEVALYSLLRRHYQ